MERFEHIVLGSFNLTRFGFEKSSPTEITELDLIFPRTVVNIDNTGDFSDEQVAALIDLVNIDKNRRIKLEQELLEDYTDILRPQYLKFLKEDYQLSQKEILNLLPEISQSKNIWSIFGTPREISLGFLADDDEPVLSFYCSYDDEHDIHIQLSGGSLLRVWNE